MHPGACRQAIDWGLGDLRSDRWRGRGTRAGGEFGGTECRRHIRPPWRGGFLSAGAVKRYDDLFGGGIRHWGIHGGVSPANRFAR
jgi:hypothetical protein